MSEKKNLDSVQILRGVAAMSVVVHHACTMVADNSATTAWLNQLAHFPDLGAAGVDIFFVISGFIMVYVSRGAWGRPGATVDFWRRRVLRIVPLYWLYTTAMLALVLTPFAMKSAVFSTAFTVKSYLFIPAYVPGHSLKLVQPLLSPGWTLFYEMFFYLLFGLWLKVGRPRTLAAYLLAVFAVGFAISRWVLPNTALGDFLGNGIVLEFLFGAIIGLIFVKSGAPSRGIAQFSIGLAIVAFAASGMFPANFPLRWLIWGVPAALLVYGSLATAPRGWLAALWVRLGDASYSIYLLHVFMTLTVGGFLRRGLIVDRLPPDLLVVATTVGCAVAGCWAYKLVEQPLTRWIAARFPHPTPVRPPASIAEPGAAA